MCFRSSLNACRSSSPAKYLLVRAHSVIVATTRPTSCLMLALRSTDLPAKIFRNHDVGRLLRPELRNLDVALLEDDLAALVADDGGAKLPFDLVERIDSSLRKESRERQPGRGRDRLFRARRVLVFFVFVQKRVDVRWRARPHTALDGLSGTRGLVASAFLHVPSTELTLTHSPPNATAVALLDRA